MFGGLVFSPINVRRVRTYSLFRPCEMLGGLIFSLINVGRVRSRMIFQYMRLKQTKHTGNTIREYLSMSEGAQPYSLFRP